MSERQDGAQRQQMQTFDDSNNAYGEPADRHDQQQTTRVVASSVNSALASYWRRDLAVTLLAGLALALWDASGADLWVSEFYGTAHGFVWRSHMLTAGLLHDGGRVLAGMVLIGLAWNIWQPATFFSQWLSRGERTQWFAVSVLCLLFIPLIKRYSLTSCPWDLHEFGGAAHWVSHWAHGISDGGPGHCFPSGHASAAFAFFAGYFALREKALPAARRWLLAVLSMGLLFGWAQLARGAHYASHTAWTAWLCWTVTAFAYQLSQLSWLWERPQNSSPCGVARGRTKRLTSSS